MDDYEPGSIRTYLMQIGDIPLLSRSEELGTARQIDKARGRLRQCMLSSDYILHATVAAWRGPERQAAVGPGGGAIDQQRCQEGAGDSTLGDELPDARSAPSRNRNDFHIAVGRRKHSPEDRRAARRRLTGRRRRAAALIEEVAVRMPYLQSALRRAQADF